MQSKISSMLDAVADFLEAKGLIKEAYEIDKVSDYIEKVAIAKKGTRVWSNMADKGQDYVEVVWDSSVAIMDRGKPSVGYSVMASVFSKDSKYDALVKEKDAHFSSLDFDRSLQHAEGLAKKYGLSEDVGLRHRAKVFGLRPI